MTAETDLYDALDADVPLAALVGEQIYPDAVPQDKPWPAVVYQRGGTSPVMTIHGTKCGEWATFQIFCVAETRGSAEAIATAVVTALLSANFQLEDRSAGYDSNVDVHTVTVQVQYFT